jgi:glycosyltransferase involved in cell wall biosynthesis
MSNILIYYPSNKSSNVIETIAKGFVDKGHKVFLLTQSPKGDLHNCFEKHGISTESYVLKKTISFVYYLKHVLFLVSFCKKNNITAIQSHLQQANIIAVFAQYFIKSKVVICRHHLIEPSKMSEYFDKIINLFAKVIVVPSEVIRTKMIEEDKVKPSKIKLVPYVYDFTQYPVPLNENIEAIKKLHNCKLLILLCGRFVPLKRNEIVFYALKKLVDEKYDIKLLALDEGPGLDKLKQYVKDNNMESRVDFLGYQKNVMDYIAACDVLVHPSYTEASNNTVKEAGIHSKNVIVCSNVGDFSEYIIHKKNGYLANRENPLEEIIQYLKIIYKDEKRYLIGEELKKTVYEKFHKSEEIIQTHLHLLID